jgi:hypothetical protein
MKGVSQAVMFERKDVTQADFDMMLSILQNASYENAVMPLHIKIDLEALA